MRPSAAALHDRILRPCGAMLAATSVALAAYASHGAEPAARPALQSAALFAFGHGVALVALAPATPRVLGRCALLALALGALLFSGSLAAGHFLGWPTRLAPTGGTLMILGWLLYAVDAARR